MNKEKRPEQIAAEEKAMAIIKSCTMCEHFKNAMNYIDLFYKQFNDIDAYNILIFEISERKIELNCK